MRNSATHDVAAKERVLRTAIVAAPVMAIPIAPSAMLGIHVAFIVFVVLAAVPAGFVVLFYALWTLGIVVDGRGPYNPAPELIGDDTLYPPPIYWPWGTYQRRVRRRRHIRALEFANGVREPWPLDY